jgi:hypothetical protein
MRFQSSMYCPIAGMDSDLAMSEIHLLLHMAAKTVLVFLLCLLTAATTPGAMSSIALPWSHLSFQNMALLPSPTCTVVETANTVRIIFHRMVDVAAHELLDAMLSTSFFYYYRTH